MKRVLILLNVFILAFCSCNKEKQPNRSGQDADFKKGESFFSKQNDSAYYYFNKVTSGSRDSLEIAMAYNYMAAIQSDAGDYFGSQESLLTSLGFLDERNKKHHWCLSSNYNELGIASYNLKNYDASLRFYDLAVKLSADKDYELVILNNKALIHQKKGRYAEALTLYRDIIKQHRKNSAAYARVLTNMAKTKWLADPRYNAAPELLKALRIRRQENDVWGLTSSYTHLADYYAASRPDSALYYAENLHNLGRRLNSTGARLEALQKLISLSNPEAVKRYFSEYHRLTDSVQTARNAARNQFALIRYEAEKHKADNLRLQKDNDEKEYQIIAAVLTLIGVCIAFVIWYRKRKQRLHLEAQNAINENQLKISKKVHDVVANGLYRMMSEIENQDDVDREHLLDKLEDMYERSRDLSYEKGTSQLAELNFHETINSLITSFATHSTRVLVLGNNKDLWKDVNETARQEVGHVIQELMVNMKKHSQAGNVLVRFAQSHNHINISYSDDGVGLTEKIAYGNGLTNTGNRIESIGGAITFDRNTERGVSVAISFPVSLTDQLCSKAY
ncbi:MAG TPA: ATP-binding protein [Sphingobacteriaceae bacterium]